MTRWKVTKLEFLFVFLENCILKVNCQLFEQISHNSLLAVSFSLQKRWIVYLSLQMQSHEWRMYLKVFKVFSLASFQNQEIWLRWWSKSWLLILYTLIRISQIVFNVLMSAEGRKVMHEFKKSNAETWKIYI